jgi:hypothetical protein
MPPGVTAAVPEGFTIVTCVAPKVEKEVTAEAVPVEGAPAAEGAAAPAEGEKKEGAPAPAGKGEGGGDEKKK